MRSTSGCRLTSSCNARGRRREKLHGLEIARGIRSRRIDDGPRWEDEHERVERVIAVLRDAAAHSARVIGENPAHHAGVDRGGVRADPGAERHECAVHASANRPRLHADAAPFVDRLDLPPTVTDVHEEAVGDRLAGEARPGRAKRHGGSSLARVREDGPDLVDRLRPHDCARHEPVEARVRRVRRDVDGRSRIRRGEESFEVGPELRHGHSEIEI